MSSHMNTRGLDPCGPRKEPTTVKTTHIVGVDPGLVHTGVVRMVFVPGSKAVYVYSTAVPGPNAKAVSHEIYHDVGLQQAAGDPHIFVEAYRPRSGFSTDERMVTAVQDFKRELNATVVNNTGAKKVVKQPLMELLDVWKFSTVTHHQDLRAAARIGLLGMLKSEPLNRLLTEVVRAHLRGSDWHVYS